MCNIDMQFEILKLTLKKERDFKRKTLQLDEGISSLKKTQQLVQSPSDRCLHD